MKTRSRSTGEREMRREVGIVERSQVAAGLLVAGLMVAVFFVPAQAWAQKPGQVDETESAQRSGNILDPEGKRGTSRGIQMQIQQTGYGTSYGKNKVTYDEFDFWVYRGPHFDIMYYPEEEQFLDEVVAYSETAYQRLRRLLNHDLSKRTPIIFYKTHQEFQQNHILPYFLPEAVAAFAEKRVARFRGQ